MSLQPAVSEPSALLSLQQPSRESMKAFQVKVKNSLHDDQNRPTSLNLMKETY